MQAKEEKITGQRYKISRWKYWYWYLLLIITTSLSIWLYDSAIDLLSYAAAGISLVLLIVLEIAIRMEQVTLTDREVEYTKGILSRHMTRISYHSISNVELHQSFFGRMFGFGDVYIDTPGGDQFEIKLNGFDSAAHIEQMVSHHIQRHSSIAPVHHQKAR